MKKYCSREKLEIGLKEKEEKMAKLRLLVEGKRVGFVLFCFTAYQPILGYLTPKRENGIKCEIQFEEKQKILKYC